MRRKWKYLAGGAVLTVALALLPACDQNTTGSGLTPAQEQQYISAVVALGHTAAEARQSLNDGTWNKQASVTTNSAQETEPLHNLTLVVPMHPPSVLNHDFTITGKNALGFWLWRLHDVENWWSNGPHVLGVFPPVLLGELSGLAQIGGWRYDGILQASDPAPYNFHDTIAYWRFVQGKFEACPIRVGCFQSVYPWMQNFMHGWDWYERSGS